MNSSVAVEDFNVNMIPTYLYSNSYSAVFLCFLLHMKYVIRYSRLDFQIRSDRRSKIKVMSNDEAIQYIHSYKGRGKDFRIGVIDVMQ